jgi:hypothetical protein
MSSNLIPTVSLRDLMRQRAMGQTAKPGSGQGTQGQQNAGGGDGGVQPQQPQQPARQAQRAAGPAQAPAASGAAETTATVTSRTVTIRRRARVDDAYVTVETREGTRAFRNNNPGNIVDGNFAQTNGAVGTDGRFAVFPDAAAGFQALNNLLMTPTYQNLSVDQAIARYAPPNENNTAAYQAGVRTAIGATGSGSHRADPRSGHPAHHS